MKLQSVIRLGDYGKSRYNRVKLVGPGFEPGAPGDASPVCYLGATSFSKLLIKDEKILSLKWYDIH